MNVVARPHYFAGLDPLRAFAALSVLSFHVMGLDGFRDVPSSGPLAWIRGGWVGLDIFFVISGMVVGQSAIVGFRSRRSAFWKSFATHRLARIVPLYLVTGIVSACFASDPLIFADVADAAKQVLSHLFFLHSFWSETALSINPPSWSLAVEMQLYALLMLALPALLSRSPVVIAICCMSVALAYRVAVFFWLRGAGVTDAAMLNHAIYQTPGLVDSFGLGVAGATAMLNVTFRRPGRMTCAALIVIGMIALWFASWLTLPVADGTIWATPVLAIGMRTGIALAALCVVLGCTLMPLRTTRLKFLGDLSYGIYLWHFMALWVINRVFGLAGWPLLAAVVVVTVGLAAATWRLVERPALHAVLGKTGRRQNRESTDRTGW